MNRDTVAALIVAVAVLAIYASALLLGVNVLAAVVGTIALYRLIPWDRVISAALGPGVAPRGQLPEAPDVDTREGTIDDPAVWEDVARRARSSDAVQSGVCLDCDGTGCLTCDGTGEVEW